MHTETVVYQADGLEMRGELYIGEGQSPRPGILVFPEAFGLGDHAKERARRLAEMGYAALACDLHGNATLLDDLQQVIPLIRALSENPERMRARGQEALAALQARTEVDENRVAAIGFCFGGAMALELARSGAPLAATVGFHSTLRTQRPEDAANIQGRVLVAIGADDPMIDVAQRTAFEEEMRAGGVDWQIHLYGGVVHSFTNPAADRMNRPEAIRYSPSADARSWKAMCDLFAEAFAE